LYFTAATFQNGRELWRFTASDLSTNTTATSKLHLNIFPNPVTNILNIASDDNLTINRVVITDVSGKKVLEQSYTTQVNVQNLAKGMYVLEVFVGQNKETRKFIKD
jgi:Secretion system C-terminal sorting domain